MEGSFVIDGVTIKQVRYEEKYEMLIRDFPSKNSNMDKYVTEKAVTDKENGLGVTFLFLNEKEDKLYGYYSLSSASITYDDEDSGEFLNIPSIEIKLFAINSKFSNKYCLDLLDGAPYKYSDAMFWQVLNQIFVYSEEYLGIEAILVRSTPEAVNFYLRHGFHHYENFSGNLMVSYDEFAKSCIPLVSPFKSNRPEAELS